MASMASVRVTASFAESLEEIRSFLEEHAPTTTVEALTTSLFETVIPNLERYPELGRSLLARSPGSAEGRARLTTLAERLPPDADIREYISGDYLVLYALLDGTIALLSIKHHRQLSYDLARFYIE